MFYRPEDGHNLPHNPFNAIVSPRPIGWISTRGTYEPPQVMFASTTAKPDRDGTKDSVSNIRETGVFCVNVVEYTARDVMNVTSGAWDKEVDEFAKAGIERVACDTIPCSRVAGAPASLECKLTKIVQLPGATNFAVFGEVIGVHMRDDCIVDGMFDVTTFQPLARLGYQDYTYVKDVFSLTRPGE